MDSENRVYRDLQKHLDRMPVGYPATESGVEIRILKHLFTPEEAKLAMQLSMVPEPIGRIYQRFKKRGASIEQLQQLIDRMVQKGTISVSKVGGEKRYGNAQFAIGMYELQVDRLTKDFVTDFRQYFDETFYKEASRTRTPQLRTIPIEKSITTPDKYQVSDYDSVRKIIENVSGQIAAANCVCRQTRDLEGKSCTVTDLRETCLIFDSNLADHYIQVGIGHPITKEKALNILEKAQEAGLVLQPANSQLPGGICCCCGDCCGILLAVKKFPRPADFYATNYYAEVEPALCTGCQECMEKCQLGAPTIVNGVVTINLDRCIGCGNCVVVCSSQAIQLRKKEEETLPPKNSSATYVKILSEKIGKWNLLKLGAKMLLRQKV
ncbi:MAG: 4Fe-4S binding protein [Chloroflexota bacterium]